MSIGLKKVLRMVTSILYVQGKDKIKHQRYETILSGRVIYARRRCNAGALSVYLINILLTSRQLFFDTERENIHCSIYLSFTDRDTCYD